MRPIKINTTAMKTSFKNFGNKVSNGVKRMNTSFKKTTNNIKNKINISREQARINAIKKSEANKIKAKNNLAATKSKEAANKIKLENKRIKQENKNTNKINKATAAAEKAKQDEIRKVSKARTKYLKKQYGKGKDPELIEKNISREYEFRKLQAENKAKAGKTAAVAGGTVLSVAALADALKDKEGNQEDNKSLDYLEQLLRD